MRLFPDGIRSAVIDSGIPSNAEYGLDFLRGETDLANRVFAGCEANRACRGRYPDLRRDFYRRVRRTQPGIRFGSRCRMSGPKRLSVLLDGVSFMNDVNGAFWPGGPGARGTHHQVLQYRMADRPQQPAALVSPDILAPTRR